MQILLDEDFPHPGIEVLRHVLRGHRVDHIHEIRWSGKPDEFVYADARKRGYDVVITNDGHQMTDPDECRAVRRSGLHRVSYEQGQGLKGLANAIASILAAMPALVEELEKADSQRLVAITGIDVSRRRYDIVDPRRNPPNYWT